MKKTDKYGTEGVMEKTSQFNEELKKFLSKRSNKALILSLFVHVLVFQLKLDNSSFSQKVLKDKKVVELSMVNPELLKLAKQNIKRAARLPKQIVNNELSGKEVAPGDSRFLGEKNQTYHRQTRAAKVDIFNKAGKGERDGSRTGKLSGTSNNKVKNVTKDSKVTKSKMAKKPSLADLGIGNIKPNLDVNSSETEAGEQKRLGIKRGSADSVGLAANNDFIEDIPLGDMTNLNTKEFKFFGYYHRIRQRLEQHWGNSIRRQAENFFKRGRKIASDQSHITSLVITLNNLGEIINVEVAGASGIRELDRAAIDSFNKAGPFPNPPKGMLNRKKQAVIKWGFVVKT